MADELHTATALQVPGQLPPRHIMPGDAGRQMRPSSHSPYDPPQRFIDRTPLSSLRPVYTCAKDDPLGWDSVFSENSNGSEPTFKQ